jgi:hypothetical protein
MASIYLLDALILTFESYFHFFLSLCHAYLLGITPTGIGDNVEQISSQDVDIFLKKKQTFYSLK